MHLASQFETIVSGRHVDVGEDDPIPCSRSNIIRASLSVPGLKNLESGFTKKLGSAQADVERIVFYNKHFVSSHVGTRRLDR